LVAVATVSELRYYPVKGLAGVSVDAAEAGETGLRHDRSFMLVDPADGSFLSQRVLPAMAAVRVQVYDDGSRLVLSADGFDDAEVPVAVDGPRRDVSLFGKWFGSGVDRVTRSRSGARPCSAGRSRWSGCRRSTTGTAGGCTRARSASATRTRS